MSKSAVLLSLHGMGEQEENYADDLFGAVRDRLGADAQRVECKSIWYGKHLSDNQKKVWADMVRAHRLDSQWMRRFVMLSLADAVGLEAGKDHPVSSYLLAQTAVARALLEAGRATDHGPVIVVAQSLGAQVISSFLYDAQRWRDHQAGLRHAPGAGVWKNGRVSLEAALGRELSASDVDYLRGDSVLALLTTGCNIPVFIAAHARHDVRPIKPPRPEFLWHNYFDRDDVLGWPLGPLGGGYEALVVDHDINAGGLLRSWNWLSHTAYWSDGEVLDQVVQQLQRALPPHPVALPPAAAATVAAEL